MAQGIKSLLKKTCHQATGCVFQIRRKGKIVQMTTKLYQKIVPPEAVKKPGASLPIPDHDYVHLRSPKDASDNRLAF